MNMILTQLWSKIDKLFYILVPTDEPDISGPSSSEAAPGGETEPRWLLLQNMDMALERVRDHVRGPGGAPKEDSIEDVE